MNIVVVSSNDRCGIREYSQVLINGLEQLGHSARYIGVTPHDNQDLAEKINQVSSDDDTIIIEYEPGIFWLFGLIKTMIWLRLRRPVRILLSIHEIEPEKYPEYRQTLWFFGRAVEKSWWSEFSLLILSAGKVLLNLFTLRIGLLLLGILPHKIIIHSPQAAHNLQIVSVDTEKIANIPLTIQTEPGSRLDARQMLDIGESPFIFISPGFLFRRKRLLDVAEALPENAELWIVGTASHFDPGYIVDLEAYIAQNPQRRVRLIQDYDNMPNYLMAADAVVLYYESVYQSAVVGMAIGAGKPCIFTKLPAFEYLSQAGLSVQTFSELHRAMVDIQQPDIYHELAQGTQELQQQYSPEAIAREYLKL